MHNQKNGQRTDGPSISNPFKKSTQIGNGAYLFSMTSFRSINWQPLVCFSKHNLDLYAYFRVCKAPFGRITGRSYVNGLFVCWMWSHALNSFMYNSYPLYIGVSEYVTGCPCGAVGRRLTTHFLRGGISSKRQLIGEFGINGTYNLFSRT